MLLVVACCTLVACGRGDNGSDESPHTEIEAAAAKRYRVEVVETHPHDPEAFTQGLTFDDSSVLWEGTGLVGRSQLRRIVPETGEVEVVQNLPESVFGEGLAIGPEGFVQLTWQQRRAYRWSHDARDDLGTFTYDGEGWGLTYDGTQFIQSDGSATLTFRDPSDFTVVKTLPVTIDGEPLDQLNELEWVDEMVWANVWHSDTIVGIDPASGEVAATVDASGLWADSARTQEMTLNGIAHRPGDPPTRLWLTGKLWPTLFVVDLVEVQP